MPGGGHRNSEGRSRLISWQGAVTMIYGISSKRRPGWPSRAKSRAAYAVEAESLTTAAELLGMSEQELEDRRVSRIPDWAYNTVKDSPGVVFSLHYSAYPYVRKLGQAPFALITRSRDA